MNIYRLPLGAAALTLALGTLAACGTHDSASGNGDGGAAISVENGTFLGRVYSESGELSEPMRLARVRRSAAEWKSELSSEQYRIVREQGTERAGTGPLLKNKAAGTYLCVACGLPLFDSETKFESGTGWPSFFDEITGNVDEHRDESLGTIRTEITCARCDGHLGHVFRDGPQPTRLRYCVNSLSLSFTPTEQLMTAADPAASGPPLADAVFAGGCFWCVEAVFEELDGVVGAVSGYAGGTEGTANYTAVGGGHSEHAEAVRITYDPTKINYEDLLRVHFALHDPTTLNRQGADEGLQYRSAIFPANDEEEALAKAFIADLTDQGVYASTIVTTIERGEVFYPAESYHQNYVCNNPNQGYVQSVAMPKVAKVRKQFKDKLKSQSPLDGGSEKH